MHMKGYRVKVRKWRRRKDRRFQCHVDVDDDTCRDLLDGVWQFDWKSTAGYHGIPPDPYMNHWSDCVELAGHPDLMLYDRSIAVAMVDCVRAGLDERIEDLQEKARQQLCKNLPNKPNISDAEALAALEFATSLWMHIRLELKGSQAGSLRDAIQGKLPRWSDPDSVSGSVEEDLCVKHLWRKGGIRVEWTNNICEHLQVNHDRVKVLRNSSMLRSLLEIAKSDPQGCPYTEEFLAETLETLWLLFRPMDPRSARDNARYMEKHRNADLELAMGRVARLDLSNYPFWHRQLEVLQRTYGKKTPSGLTQWWFDRRDRVQWATFWVAFVVFILTVVFGVISSVTGVLQVYAAYHVSGQ